MNFLKLKLSCLAVFIVMAPTHVFAQESIFKDEWYVTLTGTQGDAYQSLTLIKTDDSIIMGKSCPAANPSPISYRGTLEGLNLVLEARSADELIGVYILSPKLSITSAKRKARNPNLKESYVEGYSGVYIDLKLGETKDVDLTSSGGSYGRPEKQYIDFRGSDLTLETFARRVISSFLSGDRQWLSQNIDYPASMAISKDKSIKINSPNEFLENYEKIATDTLLAQMPNWPTCNFWTNHVGLSLGGGRIWLWRADDATDENPAYGIKNVTGY